jgi:hypothetical protein
VLAGQFKRLDNQAHRAARADKRARLLTTAPRVGSIVALTYAAAIDDPGRFKSSKKRLQRVRSGSGAPSSGPHLRYKVMALAVSAKQREPRGRMKIVNAPISNRSAGEILHGVAVGVFVPKGSHGLASFKIRQYLRILKAVP